MKKKEQLKIAEKAADIISKQIIQSEVEEEDMIEKMIDDAEMDFIVGNPFNLSNDKDIRKVAELQSEILEDMFL